MNRTTVAALMVIALGFQSCKSRAASVEIPTDYVGWVTLDYRESECSERSDSWASVIRVQDDGSGCSKNWNGAEGLSFLRYFYVDSDGNRIRELHSTGWGKGGEIWSEASTPAEKQVHFFVGSETAFEESKR